MKIKSLVSIVAIGLVGGCSDPSGPQALNIPPSKVFTSIQLDLGSAVVAVGDSIQLKATAYTLTGDTLVIPPEELKWGVSDASMIRISQSGRVNILKASSGNIVYPWVSWSHNGTTRADSAYVVITQLPEPVARLWIRPNGDSVRTALPEVGACCGVSIFAMSANGDSLGLIRAPLMVDPGISQLEAVISYMGPTGVTLGLGQYLVGIRRLGPLWLRTEANVYGKLLKDSIQMIGIYPLGTSVRFNPDRITTFPYSDENGHSKTIQTCGFVEFRNSSTHPIEIIFDDTTNLGGCVPGTPSGHVPSLGRNQTASRTIRSGSVKWTARVINTSLGVPEMSGTIITKDY